MLMFFSMTKEQPNPADKVVDLPLIAKKTLSTGQHIANTYYK